MKNFMYFIWGCIKFLSFGILAVLCTVTVILFDKKLWMIFKKFIIESYYDIIEVGKE